MQTLGQSFSRLKSGPRALAWPTTLIGRTAGVLSPLLIGFLAVRFGYGPAVQSTAVDLFFAMLLILWQSQKRAAKNWKKPQPCPTDRPADPVPDRAGYGSLNRLKYAVDRRLISWKRKLTMDVCA